MKRSAAIQREFHSATHTNVVQRLQILVTKVLALITIGLLFCPPIAFCKDNKHWKSSRQWIGTWAAAPQTPIRGNIQTFRNQTLRLITHISAGGMKVRVKISNGFGKVPLTIGAAHIALRTVEAEIDPASDRKLLFHGRASVTVAPGSVAISDAVDLRIPPLSDLAVSIFLPRSTEATTLHVLAKQTSYVSAETGDSAAAPKFPVAKTIHSWPFLTGIDVTAVHGAAIVAFGSSLTDGDGTSADTNSRWPDVLAERLQNVAQGRSNLGVLNEGIIGNRLLADSPLQAMGGRLGPVLGQSGLVRFERDVVNQTGVKFVILGLGINDIAFPGSLTPSTEQVSSASVIAGYRKLIASAHQHRIRIIGTTIPPFENSFLKLGGSLPVINFYTPEKESVRRLVNDWILSSGEFDGVVDLDAVLRDPTHLTQLLPSYDSGDHLHPNDLGSQAEGNAIPLALFDVAKSTASVWRPSRNCASCL